MSDEDDTRPPEVIARAAGRAYLAMTDGDPEGGRLALAVILRTLETLRDRGDAFARAAAERMTPEARRLLVAQAAVELRSTGKETALEVAEAEGDDMSALYLAAAAIPAERRSEVLVGAVAELRAAGWAVDWDDEDEDER